MSVRYHALKLAEKVTKKKVTHGATEAEVCHWSQQYRDTEQGGF